MFEAGVNTVIYVDTDKEMIRFYVENMNRRHVQQETEYRGRPFGDDFCEKLNEALKSYKQKNRSVSSPKVVFVLPDHFFVMDTINVPTIGKKAMENAVEVGIGALYKNKRELEYNIYPLSQTKQFATFGMTGIRKELLEKLDKMCSANQISLQGVTFATNAMACGAMNFNPKLRNGTCLLLDVQESACRFAFINKGRVIGTYRLPFGDEMLYDARVGAEDVLFDHGSAESMVRIAREKAKAKAITSVSEGNSAIDGEEALAGGRRTVRRTTAKLMQRETPTDREGFVYENFRIILKWALNLLKNNPTILAQGEIDTVYMNIDTRYDFLFDKINAEEKEHGVKFVPVVTGNRQPATAEALRELDMFGGFQLKQFGKVNML